MIRFEGVSKTYARGVVVLRDFDLAVHEGELLVLLGESGSGKTTALKMINATAAAAIKGFIRLVVSAISCLLSSAVPLP